MLLENLFNNDLLSSKIIKFLIDDKTTIYTILKFQHIFKNYAFKNICKKEYFLYLFKKYKIKDNDFVSLMTKIFKYRTRQQILHNYVYQHFIKNMHKNEFIIKQSNHKNTNCIQNEFISPKNRYLLYNIALYYDFKCVVLEEIYKYIKHNKFFYRLHMYELYDKDKYFLDINGNQLFSEYMLKKYSILNSNDFKFVKTINKMKYYERKPPDSTIFYKSKSYKKIKMIKK